MTTAPTRLRSVESAPTFGDFDVDDDGYAVDDTPRCDFWMVARVRGRKRPGEATAKVTKAEYHLWALAISDAGSALHMLGGKPDDGVRLMRGIETYMRRVLVDDDGVPESAIPRMVTEADLEEADQRAAGAVTTGDDDPDEPQPIPDDDGLHRMTVKRLAALAEQHELEANGNKGDLIAGLAAHRKYLAEAPHAELAAQDDGVFDAEIEDPDARWRLVYPDGTLADDEAWDSRADAYDYADANPSSKRQFFNVLVSPDEHVELEDLWKIYGHITSKAAGRPPARSNGSSRSRPRTGRKART